MFYTGRYIYLKVYRTGKLYKSFRVKTVFRSRKDPDPGVKTFNKSISWRPPSQNFERRKSTTKASTT